MDKISQLSKIFILFEHLRASRTVHPSSYWYTSKEMRAKTILFFAFLLLSANLAAIYFAQQKSLRLLTQEYTQSPANKIFSTLLIAMPEETRIRLLENVPYLIRYAFACSLQEGEKEKSIVAPAAANVSAGSLLLCPQGLQVKFVTPGSIELANGTEAHIRLHFLQGKAELYLEKNPVEIQLASQLLVLQKQYEKMDPIYLAAGKNAEMNFIGGAYELKELIGSGQENLSLTFFGAMAKIIQQENTVYLYHLDRYELRGPLSIKEKGLKPDFFQYLRSTQKDMNQIVLRPLFAENSLLMSIPAFLQGSNCEAFYLEPKNKSSVKFQVNGETKLGLPKGNNRLDVYVSCAQEKELLFSELISIRR